MNPCPDLKRQVVEARGREAVIVWQDGLVDEQRLQVGITALSGSLPPARRGTRVPQRETPGVDARSLASWQDVIRALCDGYAVCFFDGRSQAYAWDVAKRPRRGVEKAENEPTMQGSQEAFLENLGNNLALLRKRLRTASAQGGDVRGRRTGTGAGGFGSAAGARRADGTRLPRLVGQSMSIVGTLIIGDAAVRAGLVSPGMVIVVAATGVASFTLPALGWSR
ncbi:GerA spore germination protein [Alicyclobacillus macrosporangiidus]|uniref:GerA spore germination protein n=2 Tax=Alicyclobacillus macrosporangiidus TaxID=392015 RepID=A0A1I7LAY8_9BACL|nr:GerA spore germination protein [Alicyclobacillus macrosporangiidus]